MGFLDKIFRKNNSTTPKSTPMQPINFTALHNATSSLSNSNTITSLNLQKEQSLKQLNLRKESIQSLCLKKKELNGLIARVCMVMDFSGSMSELYEDGRVQEVIERLLPIAMQFDDNGVMEAWIFSESYKRISDISLENYFGYIENEDLQNRYHMGGTNYAPVMKDVINKYIKEEPADIPTLVLFITDGDNWDTVDSERMITKASKYPIFWQFVGIGNSSFDFLEHLDEMDGRFIDNANFFSVNDLTDMDDNDLYNKLLGEYPEWITKAKNAEILK